MWLSHLWSWLTNTSRSLWSRVSRKSLITLEITTTSKELNCQARSDVSQFRMKLFKQEVQQSWESEKLRLFNFEGWLN